MTKRPKPIVLTVLDGWGYRAETKGNAIALARKPTYDELLRTFPNLAEAAQIRKALDANLKDENIAGEVAYLKQPNRQSFPGRIGQGHFLPARALGKQRTGVSPNGAQLA